MISMTATLTADTICHVALGAAVGATTVVIVYQSRKYFRKPKPNKKRQPPDQPLTIMSPSTPQYDTNFHHSLLATPARQPSHDTPVEAETSSEAQPVLNLLYNIAEEQARRDGYIHRGITCNNCGQSPLCGNRYKCANCIDYDTCERCETKDIHNRSHLFIKIKIPLAPLANPRTVMFKPLYPGGEGNSCQLTWEQITKYKKETFFEQFEIEALFQQYRSLCTPERGISRDTFDQCLGPLAQEKNLIVDRLHKFYDQNKDGLVDFDEMIRGLSLLIKGTQTEKMPYVFAGYDLENKNSLSKENLRRMFKAYFLITIELVRDVVKACEEEMMANFDDDTGKPVSALFSAPIPLESMSAREKTGGKMPVPSNPGGRESMWPVMEAMSQDAIKEMADKIFKTAKLGDNDRMTFEQFKELAQIDSSLINWFDALGTVF